MAIKDERPQVNIRKTAKRELLLNELEDLKILDRFKNKNGQLNISSLFDEFLQTVADRPDILFQRADELSGDFKEKLLTNMQDLKKVNDLQVKIYESIFTELDELKEQVADIKTLLIKTLAGEEQQAKGLFSNEDSSLLEQHTEQLKQKRLAKEQTNTKKGGS